VNSREISLIAVVGVISHDSFAASEFQEIGFGAIAATRETFPRYIRVIVKISFSGPLTHRYDISKEQVSPVFWCIFEMNHRVFRVYRYKNDLRGTGFIDWHWLHRVCYALSLNYELSDKFPESWQESGESRSLRRPNSGIIQTDRQINTFVYFAN